MRRLLTAALFCSLPLGSALAADTQPLVAQSKQIVKTFMGELKKEMQTAMKSGGPTKAVEVCNRVAPAIAEREARQTGWQKVGRTSLKVRNPANAPDAWERKVLERFEARRAAGEPVASIAYSEVVEENGQKVFRFMKAIPTGKLCVTCHGKQIAAPLQAKLNSLYPEDQARGFEIGDIRGAFTLEKRL